MVVFFTKNKGFALIELLLVILLTSIIMQFFFSFYLSHLRLEKYVLANQQGILSLQKVSASLKENFNRMRESRLSLSYKKLLGKRYISLAAHLNQGFDVDGNTISLYSLSKKHCDFYRFSDNRFQYFVSKGNYQLNDYIAITNSSQYQISRVEEISREDDQDVISLADSVNLKGEVCIEKINQAHFKSQNGSIYYKRNHQRFLKMVNDVFISKIQLLACNENHCYPESALSEYSVGFFVQWIFKSDDIERSFYQWFV